MGKLKYKKTRNRHNRLYGGRSRKRRVNKRFSKRVKKNYFSKKQKRSRRFKKRTNRKMYGGSEDRYQLVYTVSRYVKNRIEIDNASRAEENVKKIINYTRQCHYNTWEEENFDNIDNAIENILFKYFEGKEADAIKFYLNLYDKPNVNKKKYMKFLENEIVKYIYSQPPPQTL